VGKRIHIAHFWLALLANEMQLDRLLFKQRRDALWRQ
jgi:hypothetical protein